MADRLLDAVEMTLRHIGDEIPFMGHVHVLKSDLHLLQELVEGTLPRTPDASAPRRDRRVDWDAVEGLVYDAAKRGDITFARGAEMLGLSLQVWRERAAEISEQRGG